MRRPPVWKVLRELRRIRQQLAFLLVIPLEQFLVYLHARLFPQAYEVLHGDVPLAPEIAIYHSYQPDGLYESSFESIEHLKDKGFSVIFVSNAVLSDSSRRRLASLCYRVIQRPNFGYDFGGYQFAIREYVIPAETTKSLLLMNDSMWFPLFPETDLIDRLRSSPFDVVGPILYIHRTPKRTHVQTYMVRLSEAALANPAFRHFWLGYKSSRLRLWTIRHGEMRLSDVMRRAGLSVGGLNEAHGAHDFELTQTMAWLNAQLDASVEIDQSLRDLIVENAGAPEKVTRDRRWRPYLLSGDPAILLGSRGLPFLKKDRNANYRFQRRILLTHPDYASLLARMSRSIREEIASWD